MKHHERSPQQSCQEVRGPLGTMDGGWAGLWGLQTQRDKSPQGEAGTMTKQSGNDLNCKTTVVPLDHPWLCDMRVHMILSLRVLVSTECVFAHLQAIWGGDWPQTPEHPHACCVPRGRSGGLPPGREGARVARGWGGGRDGLSDASRCPGLCGLEGRVTPCPPHSAHWSTSTGLYKANQKPVDVLLQGTLEITRCNLAHSPLSRFEVR